MSIRAHGGAKRYWIHKGGNRAVLCLDGLILFMERNGGRWKETAMIEAGMDREHGWLEDTRAELSAAITRTNREARRGV
jgi:hypothetical protein